MQLLRLGAFMILIQISFALQAGDAGIPVSPLPDLKGYLLIQANVTSGLSTSLPATSTNGLLEEMRASYSSLQAHKVKLSRIAESGKFNINDGLITMVMPGGFIYAAVIQQRHRKTMEKLNNVTTSLNELAKEITEFRIATFEQNLLAALH